MKCFNSMFSVVLFMCTASTAQETNLIKNPEFDDAKHYWRVRTFVNAAMTFDVNSEAKLSGENSGRVEISTGGSDEEQVQLQQALNLEPGKFYNISFMAMSSVPHTLKAVFESGSTITPQVWSSPALDTDNTPRHFQ